MSRNPGPWGSKQENLPEIIEGLTILCPSCGEENEITPGSSLICNKCKKPLGGKDPYFRIGLGALAILVAVASGGTWAITEFVSDNRYSVLTEHAIIESCLNAPMRPSLPSVLLRKREICGCALMSAQKDFDADDYSDDTAEFFKAFEEGRKSCGIQNKARP